jgi:hypothetical protein
MAHALLQGALAPPQLWQEVSLFERLLYKNRSQHRRGRYLQRCLEVRAATAFSMTTGRGVRLKSTATEHNSKPLLAGEASSAAAADAAAASDAGTAGDRHQGAFQQPSKANVRCMLEHDIFGAFCRVICGVVFTMFDRAVLICLAVMSLPSAQC